MSKEQRPAQILCVNYHDDTNRVLAKLLAMKGYTTRTARTLGEAEQILSGKDVDLMLCRITATDGDGAAFIEHAFHAFGVPSLAIAGSIESRSRAARLSPDAMRGVIAMPVDLTTILAAIATALTPTRRRFGVCPDCRGQGSVLLLISRQQCRTCNGTGVADG